MASPPANREREGAAEAVTDDGGFLEFVLAGVGDDLVTHVIDQVIGLDWRDATEAGDRDDVAFVFVLQMFHGVVPDRAGRREPGNEDDGLTVTGDFDVDDFRRFGGADG